jgi:transposase
MLITDGQGTPIGMQLASAQAAEVTLAEQTLDSVRVARPRGRPKQRPKQVVADRGYDSGPFRRSLRRRGIRACIPAKRRPATWRPKRGRPTVARPEHYQQRWKVERTFAWLGNYRRLLIRWERHLSVYQGFFTFVLMLLCVNQLLK